jgi:hypothetical protein
VAARLVVSGLAYQALFHVHFGMHRLAPCRRDRLIDGALSQLFASLAPGSKSPLRRV